MHIKTTRLNIRRPVC